MKLFSLYKMGSKEPEYTGVTKEKKKGKKRTPPTTKLRREKQGTLHVEIEVPASKDHRSSSP
jgi:hypothetical protein